MGRAAAPDCGPAHSHDGQRESLDPRTTDSSAEVPTPRKQKSTAGLPGRAGRSVVTGGTRARKAIPKARTREKAAPRKRKRL
jgi:hypothetical protein